MLKKLRPEYSNDLVQVVLDNARYQHCKFVEQQAEQLNIDLLFLPPYSPNLNIIERLWKFTKRQILIGKYYDTPTEFHDTIKHSFKTVNTKHIAELKKLLTLKFRHFNDIKCTILNRL